MRRVGMVAALPGELKPLIRGWKRQGQVWTGRLGDCEVLAACAGIGAIAATRACERVLSLGPLDMLVSVGWAGSMSCGLQVGSATAVREVIDVRSGERFPAGPDRGQRLITIDHVAGVEEKRQLAKEFQAVLVDMEAATVARLARAKGLEFACFKGISDGPNDRLPDFNRFTGADGQLRLAMFLGYAAVHPSSWRPVTKLAKNSRAAAEQLAGAVAEGLTQSQF